MVPASVLVAAATFALVGTPIADPLPVPAAPAVPVAPVAAAGRGPAAPAAKAAAPVSALVATPAAPVAAAASGQAEAEAEAGSWEWPVLPRPTVLRGFDVGPQFFSAGHRGVDLAATPGAAVRAPAAGVVRFAGVVAGRPVLSITHGSGLISSFEPVTSALRPGEPVAAGAVVGMLSALPGHCSPACCLHWGVRSGEVYLDPLQFVRDRPRPVILKPLAGLT